MNQDISLIILCFFSLKQTYLLNSTKCWLSNFHHNSFNFNYTFWSYVYLGVYPVPRRFFIRTSKIMIRQNLFIYSFIFLKVFFEHILIMFLISMKRSYLLTAKITPDLNNFYMVWKSCCWPQLNWRSMYRGEATEGAGGQRGHDPQLQFSNKTRSKSFSFKHYG